MQITRIVRRTIATVILTAGLAYPVCAAVCPKGIGGCPSPGRCFLFVDADHNALCDYTARTVAKVTAAPAVSPAAPAPVPSVTAITPAPDVTPTVTVNASSGNFFGTFPLSPLLTEAVLFLLFTGILFVFVRTGSLRKENLPALGLSSLFGLGLSLIATSVLSGGAVAGTAYALVFMGAGTLLAAYLWYTGMMARRVVLIAVLTAAIAGFVFRAPIMPLELGGLVNVMTGVSAITAGIVVICAIISLTLVFGRTFCGTICPVGSVQELAYAAPVPKFVIRRTGITELVRLGVFVVTVIAAVYLIDLMAATGLYDLFSLTVSASFLVAAGILVLSLCLYRPVCRILCPFGVLFSVFAEFSLFRLRRTEACVGCKKCEKACPASTAGEHDSKRECYLCGMCQDACPAAGALVYGR